MRSRISRDEDLEDIKSQLLIFFRQEYRRLHHFDLFLSSLALVLSVSILCFALYQNAHEGRSQEAFHQRKPKASFNSKASGELVPGRTIFIPVGN